MTLSVNESLYDLLLQVAKDGRFGANVAEVAGRFVSDQLIALVKDGTLIRMEPLILHSKTPPSSSSSTANPA